MKNEKPSIVFFGSGPVATESLKLLLDNFNIEAVVTKPTTKSEMVNLVENQIVYSVSDKKELDDLFTTKSFVSSVAILIDFGIIVSNKIINAFPKGIINSHFSLLPDLRGADPISFAILEGKEKTGVSLMILVEAMDEGPIIASGELKLEHTETSPHLTKRLITLSDSLLKNTVPYYLTGSTNPKTGEPPTPKSQELICEQMNKSFNPTYTRKLTKSDGVINWDKSAIQLDREIRAFIEWPKSKTMLGEVEVIITVAHTTQSAAGIVGQIEIDTKSNTLKVQTADGYLCIDRLKPVGKQEMDIQAFLVGYINRIS